MDFDNDKIDEFTLALLFLVTHERHEGFGARAWKGFDWDTLNRLYEKGYISNPISKVKSVGVSEGGYLKARELFERHFVKKADVVRLPQFTADAKKRWDQVPKEFREVILNSVFCSHCKTGTAMQLRGGKMSGRCLVLQGTCKKCGGEMARVVEPEED